MAEVFEILIVRVLQLGGGRFEAVRGCVASSAQVLLADLRLWLPGALTTCECRVTSVPSRQERLASLAILTRSFRK